jgi:hypothetical protein
MAGLLSLSLGGAYACGLQARFPRRPGILLENQLMTLVEAAKPHPRETVNFRT